MCVCVRAYACVYGFVWVIFFFLDVVWDCLESPVSVVGKLFHDFRSELLHYMCLEICVV